MLKTPAMITSIALILAMCAGGAWVLHVLPAGGSVAIHFDAMGRPNGWAPSGVGLFLLPAAAAFSTALVFVLPRVDPRGQNLQVSASPFLTITAAVNATLAVMQYYQIKAALGGHFAPMSMVTLVMGLLFIVMGNVMGKLRWNYTVGIRTPWTLANERVWDKTHRFGGWVFVAGGTLLVAMALIAPGVVNNPAVFTGVLAVVALLPIGKSYFLWREQRS
jgi:uncharacterized membrane protein